MKRNSRLWTDKRLPDLAVLIVGLLVHVQHKYDIDNVTTALIQYIKLSVPFKEYTLLHVIHLSVA